MDAPHSPETAAPVTPSAGSDCEQESLVADISGNTWQVASPFDRPDMDCTSEGLYIYRNTFNLLPSSIGELHKLKTLKFFANEVEVLPPEAGDLVGLEKIQIKVSSPRVSEIPFRNLKSLKELELCKVPPRPSALSILSEISNLKCLTKLSICHFSIRYFPLEIGSLKKLEELDLSFNKIKNLPNCIAELNSLKLLKIANNKLVDLPPEISSLRYLQSLDLSNNRLTTVSSLKLSSMLSLQYLNLQFNRIAYYCKIPPWICCDMRGNGEEFRKIEEIGSTPVNKNSTGSLNNSSSHTDSTLSLKIHSTQRTKKTFKRPEQPQQRARNERLNYSRNCKSGISVQQDSTCEMSDNMIESEGKPTDLTDLADDGSCISTESKDGLEDEVSSAYTKSEIEVAESELRSESESESCEKPKSGVSSKRHQGGRDSNPKPSKCMKPVEESTGDVSYKYSAESYCGVDDTINDGFYDAGRDQPFMQLRDYENTLFVDSREVILLDRELDEELDAIVYSAQLLLSSLRRPNITDQTEEGEIDNVLRASILSLFVSDCFGGSDRTASLLRARRSASVLNKELPFVCTCGSGIGNGIRNGNILGDVAGPSGQTMGLVRSINFAELCDRSLWFIKERRKSNVVPLGALQFGVCRHRAVLMKYLCDRVDPPIPCELIRGYLDYMPHAWNAVLVRSGAHVTRMIVDSCYPANIREESDPEYFCRYVPLSRMHVQLERESTAILGCSFPSPSLCKEIETSPARSVYYCKMGNLDAAVKVRYLDTRGATKEKIQDFEYNFLAEVRMLGTLRNHSCIVDIYGHQLSCKWVPLSDSSEEYRLLQAVIVMEYVKGGSLKGYIERLNKEGKKHVPLDISLHIARDVACALLELHNKQIIHRDVKSENILIDLDPGRSDGGVPLVKLTDFDRSVPLNSPAHSHTCCISHLGVHPPSVCVGTPRWMAPEVLHSMHRPNNYGLEVDIWSYGCFLLELLTLQVPYQNLSDSEIYDSLQRKQCPRLTEELEEFYSSDEPITRIKLGIKSDTDADIIRLIIDLFYQCTSPDPADRPTAEHIYNSISSVSSSP